jgi:hypothetical protein
VTKNIEWNCLFRFGADYVDCIGLRSGTRSVRSDGETFRPRSYLGKPSGGVVLKLFFLNLLAVLPALFRMQLLVAVGEHLVLANLVLWNIG